MNKKIHIIGGGTTFHAFPHFSFAATAYGSTARTIQKLCEDRLESLDCVLHLTKMAGGYVSI